MDFASASVPPFEKAYRTLFMDKQESTKPLYNQDLDDENDDGQKCEMPLIDISRLNDYNKEGCLECKREIVMASKEWGFFQVVNHGISREVLEKMSEEQVNLFRQPFENKTKEISSRLDVKKMITRSGSITNSISSSSSSSSDGSCSSNNKVEIKKPFGDDIYRWGAPTATSLDHFSWSEAFHIPLSSHVDVSHPQFKFLRFTMEEFAMKVSSLAERIAEILAESLGHGPEFFKENCSPNTCYLRLNRYPPCPFPSQVFGLMPHTDSDFLTVVYQDQVGGLQMVKNGRWISVKPNPDALVINIGDLFQAWSNDVYKSVEHRVIANGQVERYSMAYFYCPSYDTVIKCCVEPPMYKDFNFKEYREQVQEDVRTVGYKVGLPKFLQ